MMRTTDSNESSEVLALFSKTGALLEGHFILSSGLHSGRYLQCALVLQHPDYAAELGRRLAAKFSSESVTAVVAPAIGGIIVAHEVARAIGVRAMFTERESGIMTLRRGFRFEPDERVLVVEDVITTGGSTIETIDAVRRHGATVVGAGSLIDRSGGSADIRLSRAALVTLHVPSYSVQECPLCRQGIPATKPGSRLASD